MILRGSLVALVLICLIGSPILAADSFVRFVEVTNEGSLIPLAANQFYFNVDINSYINVDFAPTVLLQDQHLLDSPESKRLRSRLADLTQLLHEADQQLASYLQEIQLVQPQLANHDDPELRARFRQALQGHGKLILNILNLLEPVVGEEALNQALLAPDPTYRDLLTLLRKRIEVVQKELQQEVDQVLAKSQLNLRVWCIEKASGKNPVAIHLKNYDDLHQGTFQMVDKVTFAMSEDVRKQVLANAQQYQSLQSSLKNIDLHRQKIQQVYETLNSQLISELKVVQDEIQGAKAHPLLLVEEIQQKIGQIPPSTAVDQLQKSLNQLHTKVNQVVGTEEEFVTQLNELGQSLQKENPLLWADQVLVQFNQLKQTSEKMKQQLDPSQLQMMSDLLVKIVDQAHAEQISASKELLQKIEALPSTFSQNWLAKMPHHQELVAHLDLNNFMGSLQNLIERISFTENLAGDSGAAGDDLLIPDQIRNVNLADALPTQIDIPWTQRKENDLYLLTVQVRTQNDLAYNQQFYFRVKNFGFSSKWVTHLALVKKSSSPMYQPVTALSWVLHYQRRNLEMGKGVDWKEQFWDLFDPGIGFSSITYSGEKQFENGFGLSMTLFDDRIQFGYGVSLLDSGSECKDFFFFGTSLFHFLTPAAKTDF